MSTGMGDLGSAGLWFGEWHQDMAGMAARRASTQWLNGVRSDYNEHYRC